MFMAGMPDMAPKKTTTTKSTRPAESLQSKKIFVNTAKSGFNQDRSETPFAADPLSNATSINFRPSAFDGREMYSGASIEPIDDA